jgi:D,D-heptose 1,7-bisphosphate phosphatase
MKKAIFLDRDWTINLDSEYVYRVENLVLLNGVIKWLQILKNLWYLLIIITNQSGIWRWYFSLDDCKKFNDALERELWIKFDEIYICPHKPEENCDCRKPKIWNILKAKEKFWLNLKDCYFVWDKDSDILCWKNAGCKTISIKNDKYEHIIKADFELNSILEFANILNKNIILEN